MIYHSEAVSAALRANALRAAMDAIAFWLARECDEVKSTFDVDLMRKTEKGGKT